MRLTLFKVLRSLFAIFLVSEHLEWSKAFHPHTVHPSAAAQFHSHPFCLLCENASGPFKYSSFGAWCQVVSAEGTGNALYRERVLLLSSNVPSQQFLTRLGVSSLPAPEARNSKRQQPAASTVPEPLPTWTGLQQGTSGKTISCEQLSSGQVPPTFLKVCLISL